MKPSQFHGSADMAWQADTKNNPRSRLLRKDEARVPENPSLPFPVPVVYHPSSLPSFVPILNLDFDRAGLSDESFRRHVSRKTFVPRARSTASRRPFDVIAPRTMRDFADQSRENFSVEQETMRLYHLSAQNGTELVSVRGVQYTVFQCFIAYVEHPFMYLDIRLELFSCYTIVPPSSPS
jgi:hypothetical protein